MSRSLRATSKGLAAQRLRKEREAAGLSQDDVARHYRGGVSQCRIQGIETGRRANTKQVELDFRQAIALASAAQEAARSTAKRLDEQFGLLMGKMVESQREKERPKMTSLRECAGYLATCSPASLQAFGLAKMDEVSYLLKQLSEMFAQAVQEKAEAELAWWLLDYRQGRLRLKAPPVLDRPVRRALPGSRKMLKARKEGKR